MVLGALTLIRSRVDPGGQVEDPQVWEAQTSNEQRGGPALCISEGQPSPGQGLASLGDVGVQETHTEEKTRKLVAEGLGRRCPTGSWLLTHRELGD